MASPTWGPDSSADEVVIAGNLPEILNEIRRSAGARSLPTVELAHDWHRGLYAGVSSVPAPHYLGTPRGSRSRSDADLHGYEVVVRNSMGQVLAEGAPSGDVAKQLRAFEKSLRQAVGRLDGLIRPGRKPADERQLHAVINLAAQAHGEWVRIHPYANGNGRVARVWANWVAIRYGLPPFVRIKPRPDGLLYAEAALESMDAPGRRANHDATANLFLDLLLSSP